MAINLHLAQNQPPLATAGNVDLLDRHPLPYNATGAVGDKWSNVGKAFNGAPTLRRAGLVVSAIRTHPHGERAQQVPCVVAIVHGDTCHCHSLGYLHSQPRAIAKPVGNCQRRRITIVQIFCRIIAIKGLTIRLKN